MQFRQESSFLRARASQGMYLVKLMPATSVYAPMFSRIRCRCPIRSLPCPAAMGVSTSGLVKSRDVKWPGQERQCQDGWPHGGSRSAIAERQDGAGRALSGAWFFLLPCKIFAGQPFRATTRAGRAAGGQGPEQGCCRSAAGERKGRVTTAGAGAGSGGRKMTGERKVPLPFPGNNAMSARAYSEADTRRSRRRS